MANDDFQFHGRNPDGTPDETSKPISLGLSGLSSALFRTAKNFGQTIKDEVNRTDRIAQAQDESLPPFMRNKAPTQDETIESLNKSIRDLLGSTGQVIRKNLDDTPASTSDIKTQSRVETKVDGREIIAETAKAVDAKEGAKPVEPEKFKLTPELKKQIRELPDNIKTKIFGQDEVVDDVIGVLKTAFAGLSANKKKPRGAYIFAGPSGCGKTETVMQIAEFLNIPVKKFSMTEFSEENDVKKLIGSPPGYIGYEDGGQLTNFAAEHPNGIVLFDEIEKADPSISKILLGMLEDGKLTDNKGVEVSFSNTMFFATSNLGSEIEYVKNVSKEDKDEYRMNQIKNFFAIEVINRFDSIIQFKAISREVYGKIAAKVLTSLVKDFSVEHEIDFTYDSKILDFIVENSYDPAMGGRPAGRFMAKVLISGIVDKIFDDSDAFENVKALNLSINDKSNLVFEDKEGNVVAEIENTADLLSRYKQNRLTKEEKETAAKAEAIPALTPPENPIAPEPISLKIANNRRQTRDEKNADIVSGDPVVANIQKAAVKKRTSPRKS